MRFLLPVLAPVARRVWLRLRDDTGMTTAEYAVGTVLIYRCQAELLVIPLLCVEAS
ncbi:DUF4244 domain-containing protein [Embleya sp. NPDC005575]|uniref:DUF4244 domain-containing protein n=1 Tax=Embleya sp. NPDC005575 TaxID=3156892 RepID=UPI0033AC7670